MRYELVSHVPSGEIYTLTTHDEEVIGMYGPHYQPDVWDAGTQTAIGEWWLDHDYDEDPETLEGDIQWANEQWWRLLATHPAP